MEQVKELFTDCTDVFEELMAVKKHLGDKIHESQLAVENIQCSLSEVDALGPKSEAQLQVHRIRNTVHRTGKWKRFHDIFILSPSRI